MVIFRPAHAVLSASFQHRRLSRFGFSDVAVYASRAPHASDREHDAGDDKGRRFCHAKKSQASPCFLQPTWLGQKNGDVVVSGVAFKPKLLDR